MNVVEDIVVCFGGRGLLEDFILHFSYTHQKAL